MSEEMRFTRGPWHRRIGRDGNGEAWTQDEQICNDSGVAAVRIMHDGSVEGVANALLIAAAPDLYEALSAMMRFWLGRGHGFERAPEWLKVHAMGVAALAKAEPPTLPPQEEPK